MLLNHVAFYSIKKACRIIYSASDENRCVLTDNVEIALTEKCPGVSASENPYFFSRVAMLDIAVTRQNEELAMFPKKTVSIIDHR